MALNTAKFLIVSRRGVALRALIPLIFVISAVNWEKSVIMVKGRWCPTGISRMAGGAIRGKTRCCVVGIRGLVVII